MVGSQYTLLRHHGSRDMHDRLLNHRHVRVPIYENDAALQRVALREEPEFESGPATRCRKTTQIEQYGVGNAEQLAHRFSPNIIRAKRFVDAIASVRIRRHVELGKPALQGRSVGHEYLSEASAQEQQKLVGFEIGFCQIGTANHVNRPDKTPAKSNFVEQALVAFVAGENPKQQKRSRRFPGLDAPEKFSV